jgi:hypothetical protein
MYIPIKQEVEESHRRLLDAGGIMQAGESCPIEDDYYVETIRKAALEIVIEGVRYWEAKPILDVEECREQELKTEINRDEDDQPW